MAIPECLLKNSYASTIQNLVLKRLDVGNVSNVEIEARIGRIVNKITTKRISFDIKHPIVFESLPNEYRFVSGVEKPDFDTIKHVLFPEIAPVVVRDRVTVNRNIRKIEQDGTVRYEKKVKILSIDVHLPDMLYDVRVSASREVAVDQREFNSDRTHPAHHVQRDRDRESFRCNEYSFDFTRVSNTKRDAPESPPRTYEIEMEIKDCRFKGTEFVTMVLNLPVLRRKST